MELIIVIIIMAILCYLFLLFLKQQNNLKERAEQLESENIEQNKRLIKLEKRVNKLENGSINEKRNNSRENKTSHKFVR